MVFLKSVLILKSLLFISILYLFFIISSHPVNASVLYLSPGKGSIYNGGTSSIQVRINTQGEAINAVAAYLSYPTDKVKIVGLSFGSSFSIPAEGAYGGGIIHISRGNLSGVIGDVNVATIAVQGLVLGSSPTISFASGSHAPRLADSSDSLNLTGSNGGNSTTVSPPTPTPPH